MSVDLKKQDFFPKSIKLYFLNKKNNGSSILGNKIEAIQNIFNKKCVPKLSIEKKSEIS